VYLDIATTGLHTFRVNYAKLSRACRIKSEVHGKFIDDHRSMDLILRTLNKW